MKIHILPIEIINKIAAGEILEKPANAVKELVENAIDAGSTSIKVELEEVGRNLIRVTDNGVGISREDLPLAIEKHATSKLNTKDLYDISYLGFRGEALHSIAITSEMKIASCFNGEGYVIDAQTKEVKPHHIKCGTLVEVRKLFHNIPNKLRFLRSEKTELSSIIELLNRLALVNPNIAFELISNGRQVFDYQTATQLKRMEQLKVLGKEFVENMIHVKHTNDGIFGELFLGLPTLTQKRNNCLIFVNGRPVKDSVISSVMRHAYNDYIPKNTYPIAVIFIRVHNNEVDVNIHPNKSEVKFRDPQVIRRFLLSVSSRSLLQCGRSTSTTVADRAVEQFNQLLKKQTAFRKETVSKTTESGFFQSPKAKKAIDQSQEYAKQFEGKRNLDFDQMQNNNGPFHFSTDQSEEALPLMSHKKTSEDYSNKLPLEKQQSPSIFLHDNRDTSFLQQQLRKINHCEHLQNEKHFETFGKFKCQVHGTFIITETENEMIIIDQHAAHERILYEQMKKSITSPGQNLLTAEFVPLSEKAVEILSFNVEKLKEIGLVVERVSHCAVMVNSLPEAFKNVPTNELIEDIASLLEEEIEPKTLLERIHANIACKRAIKANHNLTREEIEELLTLMEDIPHTGQCNHGRPTHIRLPRKEIEKLFLRS
ncbi:DNA mismatch repair endonuclease MutL [Neorickettsia sennetsu]|uniref:DNA mismatch repair protein MutL n=1 Tax=Ehrlichia sennetsu (strain ATCC VR-367 / Miyayama) TaxID=222891 RepID=MUTL_EHRS3|nr:DNA mismatch repair endonuclease MutL [Neorickettsia sennetsu]Q2GDF7.1 RecName: Full=DNA mismatch repair protein MutL [Neorickettsia sennetsu str. Miyayama]ABD45816.1 DNA mismatch repair protein, MutL/HexB family [Neorickettsia sennetsu str. Miyayama]